MLQPEQKSRAVQGTTTWLCVLCPAPLRTAARRTITSSKIRYKKTEGQHFEEVVPSFKEVVKQDSDLKTQRNKQTILA